MPAATLSEAVSARGPLSAWVLDRLAEPADAPVADPPKVEDDPLIGDDLHLALYLCYELHYRALPGVDDAWEWRPELLAFRAALERPFELAVRARVARMPAVAPGPIDVRLREVLRLDDGPSLPRFLEREGTVETFREFLIHRSAYQLKEADPHAWAIPRLTGATKVALLEIESDEFGGGDARWMHSRLFAQAMRALGLDATVGAYLDVLPGATLATVNLMSLFGLHRRWRGAIVGHLAGFEMTSCVPNRRYANGLRRLGFDDDALVYFDEHVEADAVHESIAANDLAGSLIAQEPALEDDVLFGTRALCVVEATFAQRLIGAWSAGRSSLVEPLVAV
ncbi:MAG TPA: iron-containing redox enzyme family protein [Actinomycetota bacterium]|nr:iron-containing redox enzyme family protein [Actinomycetota bacterium]